MIRALLALLLCASSAGAWTTTRGFDDTKAPAYFEIPAAGCQGTTPLSAWDLLATTPAVAACTGTNIPQGVLDFADSGVFQAFYTVTLPTEWTTNRLPDVSLYWQTVTATATNMKWTVQFVCSAVNNTATDDPTFPASGNGFNVVTTALPTTTTRVQTSTIAAATLPASCVTNTKMLLHIRLSRDPSDGADTATGATIRFKGMELIMYKLE